VVEFHGFADIKRDHHAADFLRSTRIPLIRHASAAAGISRSQCKRRRLDAEPGHSPSRQNRGTGRGVPEGSWFHPPLLRFRHPRFSRIRPLVSRQRNREESGRRCPCNARKNRLPRRSGHVRRLTINHKRFQSSEGTCRRTPPAVFPLDADPSGTFLDVSGLLWRFLRLPQPGNVLEFKPFEFRLVNVGLGRLRSEEHTSELQSRENLVCRLLLEKKK